MTSGLTLPILYSFRRCPYAMRARLALLVSDTAVELREIVLRDKPAAMIAASPKGTVPVLVLADGTVLDESFDILRWALAQNDPEGWLGGDDAALIVTFDTAFKHHLDRYKYPDRHGTDSAEHRTAALALLGALEPRLAGTAYLCGNRLTLTDTAILPFVRQFAAVEPDWFAQQPLPHAQRWLAAFLASPLFARAMRRVPPWRPGDAPVMLSGEPHPPG